MGKNRGRLNRWISFGVASLLAISLGGCGGGGGGSSDGAGGNPTPPPPTTGNLNITITSVKISSPPVVSFKVTDGTGAGVPGLAATDLRFGIAKLVPGTNGGSSSWQNYINRVRDGAVQGSQERSATGYSFGTLQNYGDGTYTYTFATDITNPVANPCPAPCTTADGKPLDLRYSADFTHRVTIQQGNSVYPRATGVYDFVPSGRGGAKRDVVLTATCNECHSELTVHGTRVDTKLCVTCHNPGSWVAGTPNTTVDFKVMIHKIHYNIYNSLNATDPSAPNFLPRTLPSVTAGYPYKIGSADFSEPTFPQDARNCTRCHDGARSAQGDNWKTQPGIEACSSCHDNVYFGSSPDPAKPYQTEPHPAGAAATDDSTCVLCHGPGKVADVSVAHNFPARMKEAAAKFKFNILGASPTTPGSMPVITFSVTDPTNGDAPYDIKTHPAFTTGGGLSTLNVKLAWTQSGIADIGNDGNGQTYGQPVSVSVLSDAAVPGAGGTYTVTSPVAIPTTQTGTMRVMMDGHPAGAVSSTGPPSDDITLPPGTYADRLSVKSAFRDFAIPSTGTVVARRRVVDIAKCNVCHDVLSLHGSNRVDEPGVCAACHNPNATDKARRTGVGVDGKVEEAIDFKTMIHAIHAGQKSNGGFREKGVVVYGFGGSVNDFSHVVFPGKLNDCAMCHAGTSYQLGGTWESPTANGIRATTVSTGTSATDPVDNLRISPTAAVCSSCHDSAATKSHIEFERGNGIFSATQAQIDAAVPENCTYLCHGPNGAWDVQKVHGVK